MELENVVRAVDVVQFGKKLRILVKNDAQQKLGGSKIVGK